MGRRPAMQVVYAVANEGSRLEIPEGPLGKLIAGLDDPDKQILLSWHYSSLSNQTTQLPLPPRRALVITRINKQTHETIVDLSTNSVLSSRVYTGSGYPLFTFEEQTAANLLPLKYAPFLELVGSYKDWNFHLGFDVRAGEYGCGLCAVALEPMTDCPANAVFMDGYMLLDRMGNQSSIQMCFVNLKSMPEISCGDILSLRFLA
ncbi:Primary amine oxidase [Thalictrum thalictroides]|uniref:Amine oxidase n=1 Tax=Thalictrum thalictroides TaxID=46969 RepID=A0A7J6VM80_THATH|nr:Primary amine oxidase [Thalictrum thalictroides]